MTVNDGYILIRFLHVKVYPELYVCMDHARGVGPRSRQLNALQVRNCALHHFFRLPGPLRVQIPLYADPEFLVGGVASVFKDGVCTHLPP